MDKNINEIQEQCTIHSVGRSFKYCAFGSLYKDMKGIVKSETDNTVWIGYNDEFHFVEPWEKWAVKIFDTQEERNKWIEEQNFQYDPR